MHVVINSEGHPRALILCAATVHRYRRLSALSSEEGWVNVVTQKYA